MQPTVKLVPYEEFGSLRLRPFCGPGSFFKESIIEKSQGHFVEERTNGVTFWRWSTHPDELAVICIWSEGSPRRSWSTTVAPSVLTVIGLDLEDGLSYEQAASRFPSPPRWRQKTGHGAIFHMGEDSLYEINCGFMDGKNLDSVVIRRLDFEVPMD